MSNDDKEIARAIAAALVHEVGRERFDLWFAGGAALVVDGKRLKVLASSDFALRWMRSHLRGEIEAACLRAVGRSLQIEFEVDPAAALPLGDEADAKRAAAQSQNHPPEANSRARRRKAGDAGITSPEPSFHRRYASLAQFVVGPCNRLAHTSAELVAGQLGSLSPLLVHGPTGTGKSHLLEGIFAAARKQRSTTRAVLLSAEQFTSHFLEALRGSGLPSFRRKYRGVELLLIDDIQFLVDKKATLGEFLYTVDTLLREGRQLVLAADRPPADLEGLGPDLLSRLVGGLVCRIDPPDRETRGHLVRRLAQRLAMPIDESVCDYIAESLTHDVRELNGALVRLLATSQAEGRPVSLEMAQAALADIIRHSARCVGLDEIEQVVCQTFGLDSRSLRSGSRSRDVSQPRMLAMWLARRFTRAALSEIGAHFGGRTHATVISAGKKVDTWLARGGKIRLGRSDWEPNEAVRRVAATLRVG